MPVDRPGLLLQGEDQRQKALERSGALSRRGDKELQRITDEAAAAYNVHFASIALISSNKEILISRYGIPFWDRPRDDSFCAIAIHTPGEPLCVGNAIEHPRLATLSYVLGRVDKIRSCVGAWRKGRTIAHQDANLRAQVDWQRLDQPKHLIVG